MKKTAVKLLLSTIIMVLIMNNRAKAITDTIYASADSRMWAGAASNWNFGQDNFIMVSPATNFEKVRSVIRFDLSSIPPGSTITTAKLQLYAFSSFGYTRNVTAHKLQQSPGRNWTEGNGSENAVSWNNYQPGTSWTSSGGDFNSTASSTATCTWTGNPATSYKYYDWAGLASDVQGFVDNPSTNFGWLIKDIDECCQDQFWKFTSREGTTSERPRLIINYTSSLPVDLIEFTGRNENQQNILQWATASEINNAYFEVQKKDGDSEEWEIVGTVNGTGNSSAIRKYEFVDVPLSTGRWAGGEVYYRLKQTDYDGKSEYFGPINISCDNKQGAQLIVYPNPSAGKFQLAFSPSLLGTGLEGVKIQNAIGEIIYSETTSPLSQWRGVGGEANYSKQIDLSKHRNGIYFLQLKTENSIATKKIIINH